MSSFKSMNSTLFEADAVANTGNGKAQQLVHQTEGSDVWVCIMVGHSSVLFGNTLYTRTSSLHPGVQMGYKNPLKCWGGLAMDQHPIQGGVTTLLVASGIDATLWLSADSNFYKIFPLQSMLCYLDSGSGAASLSLDRITVFYSWVCQFTLTMCPAPTSCINVF